MLIRRNVESTPWPRAFEDFGWSGSGHVLGQMRRLFDDFDRAFAMPSAPRARAAGLRIGVVAVDDGLRLYAELPGFEAKDIEITVEDEVLTLRGHREATAPEGYTVHRKERGDLRIARTLRLPWRVDAEGIEATLTNGVLQMTIPKALEARPRKIEVRSA